jgi:hypothetical protein
MSRIILLIKLLKSIVIISAILNEAYINTNVSSYLCPLNGIKLKWSIKMLIKLLIMFHKIY